MRRLLTGLTSLLIVGSACADSSAPAMLQDMPPPEPSAVTQSTPNDHNPAPVVAVDVSGAWNSDEVDMITLSQKDHEITGQYRYVNEDNVTIEGHIEGTIKEQVITGRWWERPQVGTGEEIRGVLEWHIVKDGTMLAGWYREESDQETSDWNLYR
jgi:hypothetical protein